MKVWNGYQKGVNLGGWYSQCDYSKERFDHFIEKDDIFTIKGWGLDHVRLPVDYNLVETEQGEYIEEGFQRIQKVIDWCGEAGLNLILDLHKTFGYSFDKGEKQEGFFESAAYQERFCCLWEQFARHFGSIGERVSFELLNEVTDKSVSAIWNNIADRCIKRIRAIAPSVKILVGSYWHNSVSAVKDLSMPQDENIIYNFHCYSPMVFTHQGAPWVDNMPHEFRFAFDSSYQAYLDAAASLGYSIDSPGFAVQSDLNKPLGSEFFEADFAEAIQVAEERGVMLYCGEYGVIDRADPVDALNWYKAINAVFEAHNIGRAAWSYREMDFGLSDAHMAPVLKEILKYL